MSVPKRLNWTKAGLVAGAGLVAILLLSVCFHAMGLNNHAWLLLIGGSVGVGTHELYKRWPWRWPVDPPTVVK